MYALLAILKMVACSSYVGRNDAIVCLSRNPVLRTNIEFRIFIICFLKVNSMNGCTLNNNFFLGKDDIVVANHYCTTKKR